MSERISNNFAGALNSVGSLSLSADNIHPFSSVGDSRPQKRTITITQPDYGFIVEVGCQKIAIETKDKLLKNLKAYLDNPEEFEKNWEKNKRLL